MGKGLNPLLSLLINNLRLLSYTREHYRHRRSAAEDHVASTLLIKIEQAKQVYEATEHDAANMTDTKPKIEGKRPY